MNPTTTRRRTRAGRALAAACGAGVLLLGTAACGAAGNGAAAAGAGEHPGQQAGAGDQQGRRFPGAVGRVAAVADRTAQVQGMQGQVAVTWTAGTAFTTQVAATLADVKVGACVFVGSADQASSASPTTTVAATMVRITQPVDGTCGPTMRGPVQGSGPQQGAPPSGSPAGGQRPQFRGMGGAVGKVTALSTAGFTVASTRPGSENATSVAVTVSGSTAYTKTVVGAASDVKVGVCVQAEGAADDTGAITATRIAISPAQGGQCDGRVRMGPGGNGTNGQVS